MKPLLQSLLFKIGTAAIGIATACVTALFFHALHVPTQPLGPRWRVTVIAAEDGANVDGAKPVKLSAVPEMH
jgi:hypothetical protein